MEELKPPWTLWPSLAWVKMSLRKNLHSRLPKRYKVVAAFGAGSRARQLYRPDSDMDIVVILDPTGHKLDSLKVGERYHSNFLAQEDKPNFCGYEVDYDFYYADEVAEKLAGYTLIPLEPK